MARRACLAKDPQLPAPKLKVVCNLCVLPADTLGLALPCTNRTKLWCCCRAGQGLRPADSPRQTSTGMFLFCLPIMQL